MIVTEVLTQQEKEVLITAVVSGDFKRITRRRFFFDWKQVRNSCRLFKLVLEETGELLGLMALADHPEEKRVEIQLLAVSCENKGKEKMYEGVAGCLMAYACREALGLYELDAAVSLTPKTVLKEHYMQKYGMQDAGRQLYVEKGTLKNLLLKYDL
ncbi:N-acetyltransferase [Chitinophaga alhagiae]|uniref:N-acetyltransferase n=1 Tax=Chitinophaga alhagiae TaxID=2203219 RepID=UPI000E5B68D8|nr:N-acetyltransferase [Chitinophaga alhagiae]